MTSRPERRAEPREYMAGIVVFDLDGTLVNSMEVHAAAFEQSVRELGHAALAKHASEIYIRTAGAPLADQFRALSEVLGAGQIDALVLAFWRTLEQSRFPLFHDAMPCVRELVGDGFWLAVSSGGSQQSVDRKVKDAALDGLIEVAYGSDETTGFIKGRPHFDAIRRSFEGSIDIDSTGAQVPMLMVGDTNHDVQAAKACQIIAVALVRDVRLIDPEQCEPDFVIDSLSALPELAARIVGLGHDSRSDRNY